MSQDDRALPPEVFVGPEDGVILRGPKNVVAVKAETHELGIFVGRLERGAAGPLAHVHPAHEEAFYVLSGTMTYRIADRIIEAKRGAFVLVPRGLPHAFWNASRRAASHLVIVNNPAVVAGVRELFALTHSGRPFTRDDVVRIWAKDGTLPALG
jgi:quercetin dioxygenase-like cupin family protein